MWYQTIKHIAGPKPIYYTIKKAQMQYETFSTQSASMQHFQQNKTQHKKLDIEQATDRSQIYSKKQCSEALSNKMLLNNQQTW